METKTTRNFTYVTDESLIDDMCTEINECQANIDSLKNMINRA